MSFVCHRMENVSSFLHRVSILCAKCQITCSRKQLSQAPYCRAWNRLCMELAQSPITQRAFYCNSLARNSQVLKMIAWPLQTAPACARRPKTVSMLRHSPSPPSLAMLFFLSLHRIVLHVSRISTWLRSLIKMSTRTKLWSERDVPTSCAFHTSTHKHTNTLIRPVSNPLHCSMHVCFSLCSIWCRILFDSNW